MVPSPRRYGPGHNTAYLQRRTHTLLARMHAVGVAGCLLVSSVGVRLAEPES